MANNSKVDVTIRLVMPTDQLRVLIDALAFVCSVQYSPEFPPRKRAECAKLKEELAALLR